MAFKALIAYNGKAAICVKTLIYNILIKKYFSMLKTGIYTLEQLLAESQFDGFFGLRKKISITLYPETAALPQANELAEHILLEFSNEHGAYKRTYANRFADFDKEVLKLCIAHFPTTQTINVHDTAVSDGRTACDFFIASRQPCS
jgi:hypothetical protein